MGLNWWIEDNKETIIEGLGRFINIAIIIIIIIINQEFSIY
jgi:hypothetical protein